MGESESRLVTKTFRENGKCRGGCEKRFSRLVKRVSRVTTSWGICGMRTHRHVVSETSPEGARLESVVCCGKEVYFRPVKGNYRAEVACDPRCTGAKGNSCNCSCGGMNHGMSA